MKIAWKWVREQVVTILLLLWFAWATFTMTRNTIVMYQTVDQMEVIKKENEMLHGLMGIIILYYGIPVPNCQESQKTEREKI